MLAQNYANLLYLPTSLFIPTVRMSVDNSVMLKYLGHINKGVSYVFLPTFENTFVLVYVIAKSLIFVVYIQNL